MPDEFGKAIFRYIFDAICKLGALGICLYMAYSSYVHWNWFKGVDNFNCYDNNPQVYSLVVVPYTALYLSVLQLSICQTH